MTTTIPAALSSPKALMAAIIDRIERDGSLNERRAEPPPADGFTCWNQNNWHLLTIVDDRCGTALCAAGYTVELAGRKWLVTVSPDGNTLLGGEPTDWYTACLHSGYVIADETDPHHQVITMCGHRVVRVEDLALRLLGLEPQAVYDQDGDLLGVSHPLFAPSNTLADLRAWLDRLPD